MSADLETLRAERDELRRQLAEAQAPGVTAFRHIETGEIRYVLCGILHNEAEWEDVRIIPLQSARTALDAAISEAVAPYKADAERLREAVQEALNQLDTLQSSHKEKWPNERTNMVSATRIMCRKALDNAGNQYRREATASQCAAAIRARNQS